MLLGLGEATGKFIEVAGADQAALGGVIAWRHGPVGAGRVAAPDPPPRVPAPEPVKPVAPVARAPAGGHLRSPLIAGAGGLAAHWQVVASRRAAGGTPGEPGTGVTWAGTGAAQPGDHWWRAFGPAPALRPGPGSGSGRSAADHPSPRASTRAGR